MSEAASWSVVEADSHAREAAEALARRSGRSLAQWLQQMLAAEARRAGKPVAKEATPAGKHGKEEIVRPGDESPLAAIVRRLESRPTGNVPHRPEAAPAAGVSAATLARHLRASEARMSEVMDKIVSRQEESERHIAALIEALVDTFAISGPSLDNRAHVTGQSEGRTPEPRVRSVGKSPDDPAPGTHRPSRGQDEPAVDRLNVEIANLTQEIAELRRAHAASPAEGRGLGELRSDIAALGERIAGLASTGQIASMERKLDVLARQAHDPAVLAVIQRETGEIRARLGDLVRQPDPIPTLESRLDALTSVVESGRDAMTASLEKLVSRVQALDEKTADRPHDDAALAALERQLAAMAESIDALKAEPGQTGSRLAPSSDPESSPLQEFPQELRRLFNELQSFQNAQARNTGEKLEALQATLHQLATRLAAVEDIARAPLGGSPGQCHAGPDEERILFGRERPDDRVWSQDLPRSLAGDGPAMMAADGMDERARPSQVSMLGHGGARGEARSAFIAAARRAARAAAEAEGSLAGETGKSDTGQPFYQRHKRPILLGLAAVTMVMGALQGRLGQAPGRARLDHVTAPGEIASPVAGQHVSGNSDLPASLYLEARRIDRSEASMPDLARAASLYRQAALHGYAPALFRLGLAYDKGRGVGHDATLAGLWYQRAAEHGSVKAMHNLAVLYASGAVMGTPDHEQAARWFLQAAERGHAASQYNFALLAAQGLGTPRDLAQAYRYLSLAAHGGDGDAAVKRDEIGRRLGKESNARA